MWLEHPMQISACKGTKFLENVLELKLRKLQKIILKLVTTLSPPWLAYKSSAALLCGTVLVGFSITRTELSKSNNPSLLLLISKGYNFCTGLDRCRIFHCVRNISTLSGSTNTQICSKNPPTRVLFLSWTSILPSCCPNLRGPQGGWIIHLKPSQSLEMFWRCQTR